MRDFGGDWDLGMSSFTYGDIWGWDSDMEFESPCTVSCGWNVLWHYVSMQHPQTAEYFRFWIVDAQLIPVGVDVMHVHRHHTHTTHTCWGRCYTCAHTQRAHTQTHTHLFRNGGEGNL